MVAEDYGVSCGWRMFVCMKCISQYGAMKYNSQTQTHNARPSTHLSLWVAIDHQWPTGVTKWQWTTTDPMERVWTKVGMEVGSIYIHGKGYMDVTSLHLTHGHHVSIRGHVVNILMDHK